MQSSEIQEIIKLIYYKLKDNKWRQIYKTLIHTYIVCNDVSTITVEMATILIQGGGYANAADAITAANFEISGSSWTSAKEIVNVDVLREGNQWRYYFIYEA